MAGFCLFHLQVLAVFVLVTVMLHMQFLVPAPGVEGMKSTMDDDHEKKKEQNSFLSLIDYY